MTLCMTQGHMLVIEFVFQGMHFWRSLVDNYMGKACKADAGLVLLAL